MDRFIEHHKYIPLLTLYILKSNMDRFIDIVSLLRKFSMIFLKSNMDRFIGNKRQKNKVKFKF